jgi:DNA-binding protein
VPAFFVLGDDYNPNAAPEIFDCLNKVGKNVTDTVRLIELIRTRFLPSVLCRNVSCVLDSATAQHMETQINVTI